MNSESIQPDSLLVEFCEEAMEMLQELPERLSDFVESPSDVEPLHVVFRSVHTIKGNAGFFGLPALKNYAHRLEDSLGTLREGSVEVTPELVRYLVEAIDALSEMVTEIETGAQDAEVEDRHTQLLDRIEQLIEQAENIPAEKQILSSIIELAEEMAAAAVPEASDWSNRLRDLAYAAAMQEGEELPADRPSSEQTLSLSSFLDSEFRCGDVDAGPSVKRLLALFAAAEAGEDPRSYGADFLESCKSLGEVARAQSLDALAGDFDAVHQDFNTLYSSPLDLDPLLLSVIWERLAPILEMLQVAKVETNQADATASGSQVNEGPSAGGREKGACKSRFIRVREERVDGFLEDVSSLFITIERLKDLQQRMAERMKAHELVDELRQINATLSNQSTALQQGVVELRRVPARELFAKFPRVARSLASKLGKQIDVHVDGEDIEIDKSLVEDLDGPLMHMIRNVCDHGIETPQERESRGASAVGSLWLSCSLTKTHVVITVRDDGRGIDPDRLRKKAIESGWHSEESARMLSDQEATELIFHPGLSTAEQVTDISGRGVGLDVVRTRLREHNGDVKVESQLGKGTVFRLEIPIRRAVVVVDGLLVTEGRSTFVVPFDFIQEIVRIDPRELASVSGRPVVRVRGEPYAARTLSELLGIKPHTISDEVTYRDGVLIKYKQQMVFLMVQSVVGQRKVVVSDLAGILPQCDRLSGVAQLGAGRLALVVNASELIKTAGTAR